jgi:plastocyanin
VTVDLRGARRVIVPAFVAVTLGAAAPGRGPAAPAVHHVVEITGLAYHPADLEVAPGDTVTWINHDIVPHTATSPAGQRNRIDSGTLAPGDSSRYVATREGAYRYTCTFHPTMQGRLVIRTTAAPDDQKSP